MDKSFKLSLFVFRRDLRLEDNTGLIEALKNSEKVLPAFIVNPSQVDEDNSYKGNHILQFMTECLTDLNEQLRKKSSSLYLFSGEPHTVIESLVNSLDIEAVYLNKDYTPFSRKRDKQIKALCQRIEVKYFAYDDALLHPPGTITKDDGSPYTVFTPFYKRALKADVDQPVKNSHSNYFNALINKSFHDPGDAIIFRESDSLFIEGGRESALKLLKKVKNLSEYKTNRDIPSIPGTTGLSAHHKFGSISVRETYHQAAKFFGPGCTLISELYWRDFFTNIAFYFPHVFKTSFKQSYSKIKWRKSKKNFLIWCEGKTGFPIVDAGMRELNASGYMHNRVRMIVASFLTKDLHISYRWGEKYFAQMLIDYDPAVNNGNWQWAASTGCDAQPYFRVFNPWLQQKKFDPDCIYIKKWVPELSSFEPSRIHNLFKETHQAPLIYPAPIVDHSEERITALNSYEEALEKL